MFRSSAMAMLLVLLGPAAQAAPVEAWRLDGLAEPWSAWFDASRNVVFVSNVAGDPLAKDGNGFIARVGLKGRLIERDWVSGLDAPKGMSALGGQLYVADIDRIVAVDLATGEVTRRWPVPGARSLTDVYAAQRSGRVFVSDALTDTVWVLKDGKLDVFAQDAELRGPAGLRVNAGRLVVAGTGGAAGAGRLTAVSLEDSRIWELGGSAVSGHLLGLDAIGDDGWYVTDPVAGLLDKVDESGVVLEQTAVGKGAGDLAFLGELGLLLVPMTADDRLLALKVPPLPGGGD